MAREEDHSGRAERDAAAKAVTDNMAKLRAARLAREALAPPVVAKTKKASSSAKSGTKAGSKTSGKTGSAPKPKSPALAAWLAGQVNGGHRT
ncbi:hypothetical protein [Tardiphaga sp.]|uniref:hypothetical protein n=1 Tax=Tardiphaga sp. TaxID=1926292 RepID=UPI0026302A54|nr:hypothetical protein [Tardiphaga sp.]MDB5617376.1 hypothetical protein [Tardiphaga sp.]